MSPQNVPPDASREDPWHELPPGPWLARWARWVRLGAWGAATLSLAAFLCLAALWLLYPFELEWLEGGVLQHVRRVAAVLLDDGWLRAEVGRGYACAGRVFTDPLRFRTVSGTRVGPDFVYVPRPVAGSPAPPPAGPLVGIE